MAKRNFTLTDEEIPALRTAYDTCADGAERTRLQAVRLYGSGRAVAEIMDITQCTRRSLMRWCQTYQDTGGESLAGQRQGDNRALLTAAQAEAVQQKLHQYPSQDLFGEGASVRRGGAILERR